jgi:subtilisin family serine protease
VRAADQQGEETAPPTEQAARGDEGGPAAERHSNSSREKLLKDARLIDEREGTPGAEGRFTRRRLYETTFKYPMVLVEEVFAARIPGAKPELVTRRDMVADHVIVKLKPGVSEQALVGLAEKHGTRIRRRMNAPGLYLVKTAEVSLDAVEKALAAFAAEAAAVAYAEPDHVVYALGEPDDSSFSKLWGMHNTGQTGGTPDADIDALEAWGVTTGSRDILVGVIDTGVDYKHPDLAANMWTNPGESGLDGDGNDKATNGKDDDGNGFVDDVRGWDFCNADNDPFDGHSHGTHCAGTIGGVGNNGIGVAGVCHEVSMVGLKFLSDEGSGAISDGLEAVHYATSIGVRLTSNSWGGGGYSSAFYDALVDARDKGILFVAAAGNSGTDNDVSPHYPSSYTCENVIAVAATDHNDGLAYFSCYGPESVDLGAPGVAIYSTLPNAKYGTYSGTSMATPHVAGACALVAALGPTLPASEIKRCILEGVDALGTLSGACVTGGRLNALEALARSRPNFLVVTKVTVDDAAGGNGDGLLNPGESAGVTVRLANLGVDDAVNVTATLSTSDSYVTVTQGSASYGTLQERGGVGDSAPPYVISVAAGCPTPHRVECELRAKADGSDDFSRTVTLWVATSCTVSGTVRRDGSPVGGVTVRFKGDASDRTAVSGADGRYGLVTAGGPQTRQASRDGWLSTAAQSVDVSGDTGGLDFAFTTATVSGYVKDDDGKVVPGATVSYEGGLSGQTTAGTDGRYSFTRVYGRTTTLYLDAAKAGYFTEDNVAEVTVPPDATTNVLLRKLWKVRGRVTWGGAGVPGVIVQTQYRGLTFGYRLDHSTVTDANGYYVVDRRPNLGASTPEPGDTLRLAVIAWGDAGVGYQAVTDFKEWDWENTNKDITYNMAWRKPVLQGTITGPSGNPVSGATVRYRGRALKPETDTIFVTGYVAEGTATTKSNGTYSIALVLTEPDTAYGAVLDVRVTKDGYAPADFIKEVKTGTVTRNAVLGRPAMAVGPASLDVSAYPGAVKTRTVTISNTGATPLEYVVRKAVDPDDAWKVEWEREIPKSFLPSDLRPYLPLLPQTAADSEGDYWCLGRRSGSNDVYLVKVDGETWRVVRSFVFRKAEEPGAYPQYIAAPSVSGGLLWIAYAGTFGGSGDVVHVRAFDPETGEKARDFEIPPRLTGRYSTAAGDTPFAAVADDGYLYVMTGTSEINWREGDDKSICRVWQAHDRVLKLDARTGAVLDIVERDRDQRINTRYIFSMWNGMAMSPWSMWEQTADFRSRWDLGDRVSLGNVPCFHFDHPTDDAYFYGFDWGPVAFGAPEGAPRPDWGSDVPVMQLRTSGVARWMGRRLSNRCGTVPPGGSVDVQVFFDAGEARLGAHESALIVESNDPHAPSVEIPVTLSVGGIVDILDVSTDGRYEVAPAAVGTRCYTDRRYRILALDPSLAGEAMVRTADDDKYVTMAAHLTLDVTVAATVSVCVDTRIGTLPGWLDASWTYAGTGVLVETGDGAASPMRVYRKDVPAGTLVLGGNGAGAPAGDRSNYVVVVAAR